MGGRSWGGGGGSGGGATAYHLFCPTRKKPSFWLSVVNWEVNSSRDVRHANVEDFDRDDSERIPC